MLRASSAQSRQGLTVCVRSSDRTIRTGRPSYLPSSGSRPSESNFALAAFSIFVRYCLKTAECLSGNSEASSCSSASRVATTHMNSAGRVPRTAIQQPTPRLTGVGGLLVAINGISVVTFSPAVYRACERLGSAPLISRVIEPLNNDHARKYPAQLHDKG